MTGKKQNMKKLLYIVFSVVVLCRCAPTTQITGSWKSPDAGAKKYTSVVVAVMTSKINDRRTIEDNMARVLSQQGLKVTKSIDILPPSFTQPKEVDKEALLSKIKNTRATAILTVALLDTETEQRYVPGSYGYQPITRFGYYGRFMGYYTAWYPMLYSPGYYTEDRTYFMETNVYDARTEELIWSAQSESYNPDGLNGFSKDFIKVLTDKLAADEVIAPVSPDGNRKV
jgi:hypothetical protein